MEKKFSHISDLPPCREQLWDKSISHAFHDLQLCALYLAWLKCLKVCEKTHFVWFSVWDGFLTTGLRIPPSSLRDLGGIRRLVVRKISLGKHTKCISLYMLFNYTIIIYFWLINWQSFFWYLISPYPILLYQCVVLSSGGTHWFYFYFPRMWG